MEDKVSDAKKSMDITVGILTYNREQYLVECLESVIAQSISPRKIVIYDNGSKSNVYERIQPYLSDIIVWQGADGTNNNLWNFARAVKNPDTEFVMVLHDDDRLRKDFLEKQLPVLTAHPEVLALSANGTIIDKNGIQLEGLVINEQEAPFFTFHTRLEVTNHSLVSCIPMSPIIYRSSVFDKVAINSEFGKCADTGMYLDIIQQGPIMINNEPLYECRVHDFQDSSFFPLKDFRKIFDLFEEIIQNDDKAGAKDKARVRKKFSEIVVSRLYNAIRKNKGKYRLGSELSLLADSKFSFGSALEILKKKLQ